MRGRQCKSGKQRRRPCPSPTLLHFGPPLRRLQYRDIEYILDRTTHTTRGASLPIFLTIPVSRSERPLLVPSRCPSHATSSNRPPTSAGRLCPLPACARVSAFPARTQRSQNVCAGLPGIGCCSCTYPHHQEKAPASRETLITRAPDASKNVTPHSTSRRSTRARGAYQMRISEGPPFTGALPRSTAPARSSAPSPPPAGSTSTRASQSSTAPRLKDKAKRVNEEVRRTRATIRR